MTPSEVTWWTPAWKRVAIVTIFLALGTWGYYTHDVFLVGLAGIFVGYSWHQMFTSFGKVVPAAGG